MVLYTPVVLATIDIEAGGSLEISNLKPYWATKGLMHVPKQNKSHAHTYITIPYIYNYILICMYVYTHIHTHPHPNQRNSQYYLRFSDKVIKFLRCQMACPSVCSQ